MDYSSPSRASSSRPPAEYFLADGGDNPHLKETPSSTNVSREDYELPEYNTKQPSISASQRRSWRTRLEGLLEARPRVRKVWLYFRGPRPKVGLSGATNMPLGCYRAYR